MYYIYAATTASKIHKHSCISRCFLFSAILYDVSWLSQAQPPWLKDPECILVELRPNGHHLYLIRAVKDAVDGWLDLVSYPPVN